MEKTFRIIPIFILLVILFLLPKNTFAISSPTLSSPSDSSSVSSGPTLNWEAVSNAVQYKVIVDDESSISSPYIKGPYYTTNTKYSPQLSDGTFYWKVAAKDAAGSWSDWSSIWSFTLSTPSPIPTEAESGDSYSTPYSTPSTSDPTPTSSSSKSSFIISDIPSSVDSDKSFTVSVDLNLPNNPSAVFYLKGAFKKADSSNYFGFIKVGSSWIKNGNSYSSQYKITTDSAGNWDGTLEVKPDDADSGFSGSGSYIFKVGRYSSSGSGPTWSNEETLNISGVVSSEEDSDTSRTTQSSNPPQGSVIKAPANKTNLASTKSKQASIAGISLEASASSSSSTPQIQGVQEVKDKNIFNFLPIIGGVTLILSGVISLVYIYRKQKLQSKL